jgi:hypothetical protein
MNRSRFVSLVFLIVLLVNQFAILQFVPSVKATSPEIYYSGAGDGCSGFGGEDVQTWAACHHATAGEYADYTAITVIAESYEITGVTGWNVIQRTFLPFNTAALPDTATITAATLSIYVTTTSDGDNDGYDYVSVVQTTQASTSAIVVEDYDQCGAVQTPQKGAADIDITGIGTGAYLAFTLNATGIAWISLTGWTKLGIREGHDVADHQIAANKDNYVIYSTSEATGTSQDPYLNITYTVPEVIPPDTYSATTSDGYVYQLNQRSYATAQTATTGTVDNTSTTAKIGQNGDYTGSDTPVPNDHGDKDDWYSLPSLGDDYLDIDEVTPVTTDYIYARTVAKYDLFQIENLTDSDWYAAGGVTVYGYAQMNSTTAGIKLMVKTGGTSYEGTEKTLTASWASYSTVWTTNPKTGLAWTTTDLNELQIGVNLTTYSGGTTTWAFVAALYVQVYYIRYSIYRSIVFFDATTLPRAPIVSASLRLYCPASGAFVDNSFNITVMNGTSTAFPHDPLQTSDYNISDYANNGGTFNASSWTQSSYNNITITDLTWIQRTGTTKFALISSRDISATKPPTTGTSDDSEYVTFNTQEATSSKPLLEVIVNIPNSGECFVYSFNATDTAWDTVGSTPYLNNDTTNYITNADPADNMSWFFFEATTKVPQQVYLYIEGRSLLQVTVFINNGVSTSSYSVNFTTLIEFQTVNVTTVLDTANKLGNASMKIMGVSAANSLRQVIRAYLKVYSGPVPIVYGTTSQNAEHNAVLYCDWHDVDGLSTYTIIHNNTGAWCANITGSLSGADDWGNTSITVNSSSLYSVSIVFSANDSSNNWETTTYTFYIVFKDYSSGNLASLVGNVQQHSLGRNNFYCKNTQRYLVFWGNQTNDNWYYATSGDGVDWNVSALVRTGGAVPYGKFYGWVEDRNGIDYVHYQFCTELINESWYWRRGQLLSNGTLVWDATEQVVLDGTGFSGGTHAIEGLMTDELGHIYYQYCYQDATCTIANITVCDWTNGTWHTKTGYPMVVWNHTGATYADLMETALLRFPNGCYSIEAPTTGMNGKNLTYSTDTFGAVEDLSDIPLGTTTRKFSFVSNNGAIYGTFINSSFTGMFYSEVINGAVIVKDEFVTSILDTESYPVVAFHEDTSEIVLDWTEGTSVYMYLRNSTVWLSLSRLLTLEGYYIAIDPNQILPYITIGTLFTFSVTSNSNSTSYLLTYFYYSVPFTELATGWNNFTAWSIDISKTLEQIYANLKYNNIVTTIIIVYNDTEYRYDYGLDPNASTLVLATSDELRVYCTLGGMWYHDYGNFYYLKSAPSQSVSLSMVTVILISILKSASQAVTTAFSVSRLAEMVRGASQTIGIGLSSLQFIGWIETVTILIGIALATSRAAEFSGSATQSFSLGLSAERAAELAKSVIQTIATSLNVNRLIDVTRTTANTFSLSLASSRFAEFVRSASKTFNVGFATASLAEFFRSVSQALTATLNAQRLIEVFRSASQAITFSLQAIGERVGIYLRNVALTITLSLQGSRLAEWLRSVAQTISFTFETVGFAQFVRSASQAISVVLNGERMVELFRSASQTITIAFQTIGERVGIYLRNVALTITTAFEGSRLAEWIKATNQTISVTLGSSRLAEFVRTASQTITLAFTSAGEKLGNYIRNVVLTITTAFQNSRLADWTRQATQTLTLSLSTSRAAQFIALVVLTITTAFNASRLIELLRQVSQSLSFVLNGERLIEASRTVSQNITFTLQSIGEMVGNYFRNALLDVGFTFSTLAEVPEATILLTLAIALIVVACVVTFAVAKTQKEPEKN